MRLQSPRIAPLEPFAFGAEMREIVENQGGIGSGESLNIIRTLARHPKLLKRWLVFANHVLFKSTLPPREREMIILRIGWRCRSGYEWGQHEIIAREAGLSDEEIRRVAQGPEAPGWSPFERVLLRAVDELRDDAFVSEETWGALAQRYSTEQLMDLVFAVGQYNLVSMVLNSFGVQLDPGVNGLPD